MTYCDELGRTRRKPIYGATHAEVRRALQKVMHDRERGLPVNVENQTVTQFLARWLKDAVEPTVRPKTVRSYRDVVCHHLSPKIGHIRLDKLAPQHIQKLMKELTEEVSANTAAYSRTVLRIALGRALKWGLVARNVATLVDPPRHKKQTINPLTPEEARTFLKAIAGDRLEALFTVALAMGLRQGEALGLRWSDADMQARTLRIEHQLQRVKGKLTLVDLKSENSRRTLPMPETIVSALRTHRKSQLEEKMAAGDQWQGII